LLKKKLWAKSAVVEVKGEGRHNSKFACVYVRTHMRPSYTGIVVVVYINTAKVGHKLQATAQSPADTLKNLPPSIKKKKNLPPPLDRYPFFSAQGKLARELGEGKTNP